MKPLDVAVVGGGPAGAATALCLARTGRSVALLERADAPGFHAGETLAPEVRSPLAQLGVWDRFVADHHRSTHCLWSAWGASGVSAKDLLTNPYGPAWRIDRIRFNRMLVDAAARAGVRAELGFDRLEVERAAGGWLVAVRRRHQAVSLRCRFLIDATGRASAVARRLGARWRASDRLVALVARGMPAERAAVPDEVLLIETVAQGWWYSSALPEGELVAVFLTDADLVRAGGARTPAGCWTDALAASQHTRARARGVRWREVRLRPAGPGRLDRVAGPGWLAVGDAASAIDPLSGAGIAKSLLGAIAAARAADRGLAGSIAPLAAYAETIRSDFEGARRMGAAYYGRERRWPASPFWRRRHGPAPAYDSGGVHGRP